MKLKIAALLAGRLSALGLTALLAGGPGGPASGQTAAGHVLVMSDLHFDPMADPSLTDRLAAAAPEQWEAVLEGPGETHLGAYGRDTGWPLLRSALREMKRTLRDPALVLIPGDFLAHDFRRKFDATASDRSQARYRDFVRKTMRFLEAQIAGSFPSTPILPALGNNDADCGDYQLQPGGPFLADTLAMLHGLVGGTGSDFDRTWTRYGNYSVGKAGIRILSFNSNFFSPRYRNACGSQSDADPGRATFAWLENALAAARQAQERVWLVYHIPPGVDGYATLRRGACPDTIVPMWDQVYSAAFDGLLRRYSDTVVAGFAGHTHMDEFRLVGAAGARYGFTLVTPALSPIFGQDPAFRTVAYDTGGNLLDETTYALTNLAEAGAGVAPVWRAEYTFTQQWRLSRIDPANLDRLYSLIRDGPAEKERWSATFPVSRPAYWAQFSGAGGQLAQAVRAFRCAAGNILLADYRGCYCEGSD